MLSRYWEMLNVVGDHWEFGANGHGARRRFARCSPAPRRPTAARGVPAMNISMKPQKITPKFQGTVRQLFFKKIKASFFNPQFQTDVCKPLKMDDFIDQDVQHLSGGELAARGHCAGAGHARRHLPHRRAQRVPRLGAAHRGRARHQALRHAHQEDGLCRRARLYHGHVPGGPRHCL